VTHADEPARPQLTFAFEIRARVGGRGSLARVFPDDADIRDGPARVAGLTRSLYIGTGERYPSEVVTRFWRIE
jgi:hypothetical protein